MSYVRGWRVYYSNGSSYSSTTHEPTKLPTSGLQVWMLYFQDGTRRVLHGNDHYFWQDNGSDDGVFGQTDDPFDEVLARYPNAYVIEGELMPDDLFRATLSLALSIKEP